MSRVRIAAAAMLTSIMLTAALPSVSSVRAEATSPSEALFEGSWINLASGWGDAKACSISPDGNECFRTVAELDRSLSSAALSRTLSTLSTCSTAVRLYSGTSHTGTLLSLSTRTTWISLSTYGFDNLTSSYSIGACSSVFKDGVAGSGTTYPGATSAGASANTMTAGWDNTISSIFIN